MTLELVSESLLTLNKLNRQNLSEILEDISTHNLDYGDLYFQSRICESWVLENRIIKEGFYHLDQGVGIRAISGEKTGFAYADQISIDAIRKSAQMAKSIIDRKEKKIKPKIFIEQKKNSFYDFKNPLKKFTSSEKINLLYRVDHIARNVDSRVVQVNATLSGSYEKILVASTDGNLAADIRPLVEFSVSVLVEERGKIERGRSGGGSRTNYNFLLNKDDFLEEVRIDYWTKEAVRIALLNLSSKEAPSGTFPV
ncbi:Metalloprotease TldD, partial [Aphis craccivora]